MIYSNRFNSFLALLCAALFFLMPDKAPAGTAAGKKIAILNFKAYNASQTYADGVRDMLEVNLFKTGVFHILEREQIDIILREHEIRDRWCEDRGCAVQMGRLLSTDKVVVGSISGMGNFSIAIKLVDIKNGDIEYADTETTHGEKNIPAATQILADRFAARIKEQYAPAAVPAAADKSDISDNDKNKFFKWTAILWDSPYRPYYMRGLVPGWGQIYAGHFYKGIAAASIFGLAAAYTGYAVYDWRKKREEYEDLKTGTNADFDRKHDSAGDALNRAKAMLWVTAGLYILNYVDILFFSRPDYDNKPLTGMIYQNKSPFFFVYLPAGSRHDRERIDAGFNFRF